ncbi:cytidylate kinase-like family protein [Geovibrio thiophilus]|uniref:Cytidylate kinase-like family protein n=1 Tax=Geovibrio thiophilus TaxID=139438 RepID=A0A410JYN0_9BACT|nr:cytidylate kinase-like family protein [Geovibrio thiophilus]QAR33264.1 cytidylate kinase-like family protein [Geovibrio thiophilus]
MAVITVSRQFGCGGEYVAEKVAEKLGFKLFHKELIKYIAILTDTDEEKVNRFDEEQHSNFRSFMSDYFDADLFSNVFKDEKINKVNDMIKNDETISFFDTYADQEPVFDSKRFSSMVELIIRNLATDTNCVIMGRGSQCILEDEPNCLHIRLVAPFDDRVKWLTDKEELEAAKAAEQIKAIEKHKKSYIKHYYKRDIDDVSLYHSVFNLSKTSNDNLADMIIACAKSFLKF